MLFDCACLKALSPIICSTVKVMIMCLFLHLPLVIGSAVKVYDKGVLPRS